MSDFSNISFGPKFAWKLPTIHSNLEVFLSQVKTHILKVIEIPLGYSNLSREELDAIRSLSNDRTIVLQRASVFYIQRQKFKIVLVKCTFFLKFMKGYLMFQGGQ